MNADTDACNFHFRVPGQWRKNHLGSEIAPEIKELRCRRSFGEATANYNNSQRGFFRSVAGKSSPRTCVLENVLERTDV